MIRLTSAGLLKEENGTGLFRNRSKGPGAFREKKDPEVFGGSCGFSVGGREQSGSDRQEPWIDGAHNDDGSEK
jgi:hypothetical protein